MSIEIKKMVVKTFVESRKPREYAAARDHLDVDLGTLKQRIIDELMEEIKRMPDLRGDR